MSADLFAEFGYGASTSQPPRTSQQQTVTSQTSSLIPDLDTFEDAGPSRPSGHLKEPTLPSAQQRTYNPSTYFNDFADFQQPLGNSGNDVLFDATLERPSDDSSDDWGDFESPETPAGQTPLEEPVQRQKAVNKSGLGSAHSPKPPRGSSKDLNLLDSRDSISIQDKRATNTAYHASTLIDDGPAMETGTLHTTKSKLTVQDEPFEEWGDFIDGPPSEASRGYSSSNAGPQGASSQREDQTRTTKVTAKAAGGQFQATAHVRPTNIPPPSILLELFPRLFEQLRQEGTEAKKSTQQKENLEAVALSIICTLKTAARVIAGRTLRWKRDAILSQSMRIGPARSGKTGGMKLSTVNKNEDIKEQQEAVDVINMWRDRAALFNSVIQAAGRRPLQVIAENTRTIPATAEQGALKASHACALCGLKRDERLPKVDENVEDSFGEWWTDHWGHADCRQFWESNMRLLSQR